MIKRNVFINSPLNSTAGDILEKFTRPRSGVSAEDNENMAYGQTLSQEGFACLYDNYFPRLYSYVACRIGTQEETEDIVALVFEQILKKFHTYDPRRGNLDTWIFTIARNAIIDRRRYKKRHREQGLDDHLELEADFSLSEYFLKQEEINQLRTYLKRLSEKERELLILRYGAGLPHRRIGEIMNMNEGSVAVSLGRILRKLQKFFEKDAVR